MSSRHGRRVCDADGHIIEPFGIFGPAQLAERNPMALPATTPYGVAYDHEGIDVEQRSAGLAAIVRVPQGRRLHPVYRLDLDVDNWR